MDPIRQRIAATPAPPNARICPLCLCPRAFVKWDKNQRPYAVCQGCGGRMFFRGAQSLRGLALIETVVLMATGNDQNKLFALQHALDTEASIVPMVVGAVERARAWASKPVPMPNAAVQAGGGK
jgi:hypothetical protein